MKFIIFNKTSINQYLDFINNNPNTGIWHYPSWLTFQLETKKALNGFFFGIEDNGKIILGGLLLIYKNALKFNYGYIPAGFLYDEIDDNIYNFFTENINKIAKENKLVITQIDSITPYSEKYNNLINKYKDYILNVKLPIPDHTNMINLNKSEDLILEEMKPKGRYNIKLANKRGVIIKEGNENDIDLFFQLLKNTSIRDGFNINNKDYYLKMLRIIPNSVLLLAYFNDILLAAGIFLYTNNYGIYYYGASGDQMRNLMAPYLIQWKAIQIAKIKNCKYFDFLGVSPPNDNNDRLSNVTEFKLKFGGKIVKFNPSFNIIHNKLIYNFYQKLKKIIKK